MKTATVCFFIKHSQVMLALIHYPDGTEKWNGVGGVVEEGETPEQAVIREIKEEIGLSVEEATLEKRYEFDSREWHMIVFITSFWKGNPKLLEPSLKQIKWFNYDQIPYDLMFPGNKEWLSKIIDTNILN